MPIREASRLPAQKNVHPPANFCRFFPIYPPAFSPCYTFPISSPWWTSNGQWPCLTDLSHVTPLLLLIVTKVTAVSCDYKCASHLGESFIFFNLFCYLIITMDHGGRRPLITHMRQPSLGEMAWQHWDSFPFGDIPRPGFWNTILNLTYPVQCLGQGQVCSRCWSTPGQ